MAHGKAAGYQRRGVVHFHALLRLDGVDPNDRDAVIPPPAGFTAADLDDAVRHAAQSVTLTAPPHLEHPAGWTIA